MTNHSDREFYRAKAELKVRYGQDDPELRKAVALESKIWSTQSGLEQAAEMAWEADEAAPGQKGPLMDVLRWLDFKLDLILHNQRQTALESVFPHHTYTTDISGSGLGLASIEGLALNDGIMLCISLPDLPWRPIYALAKVTRLDEHGAAVSFAGISESDRERIIRYTFEMQRGELAQRTGKEG